MMKDAIRIQTRINLTGHVLELMAETFAVEPVADLLHLSEDTFAEYQKRLALCNAIAPLLLAQAHGDLSELYQIHCAEARRAENMAGTLADLTPEHETF